MVVVRQQNEFQCDQMGPPSHVLQGRSNTRRFFPKIMAFSLMLTQKTKNKLSTDPSL